MLNVLHHDSGRSSRNKTLLYKAGSILKNSSDTFLSDSAVKPSSSPHFPVFSPTTHWSLQWLARAPKQCLQHTCKIIEVWICHAASNNCDSSYEHCILILWGRFRRSAFFQSKNPEVGAVSNRTVKCAGNEPRDVRADS